MSRSSLLFGVTFLQALLSRDLMAQRTQTQVVSVRATDSLAVEPPPSQLGLITLPSGLSSFGNGRFRVSRSTQTSASLTVNLAVGGTATAGADFVSFGTTVVFPANAAFVDIDVATIRDNAPERDETVVVSVLSGTGYATQLNASSAVVTIVDANQTINLTGEFQAAEPTGDNGTISFQRLGTLRNDLWVVLQRGGNATNGVDYEPLPDSVLIPANQTGTFVRIIARPDGAAEGTESVSLRVANLPFTPASGASVSIADAVVTVAAQTPSVIEAQGNTVNFTLTRTGTTTQALTVGLTFSGSATRGADYTSAQNSATFPVGANTVSVPILINADAQTEGGEVVTLTVAGTSTTAAGTPNSASLVINDNVPPIVASLTLTATAVTGGNTISATIALNGPAPSGGMPITISSSNAAAVPAQTSVTIAAGQSSAAVQVNTLPVPANVSATISASTNGGTAVTRVLQVNTPVVSGVLLNGAPAVTPQALADSLSVSGTVTLSGAAPTGGTEVSLTSDRSAMVVPATVTVPAGQTSATFRVTVTPVSVAVFARVSAKRLGSVATWPLTVEPPNFVTFLVTPSSLAGRQSAVTPALVSGTYTLSGPAPSTGASLSLTSNSNRLVLNQTSVFATAGSTTGSWSARALPVDVPTPAIVTATLLGSSRTASVNIVPGAPATINFSPTTVAGGQSTSATIAMTGDAPSAGLTLPVSISPTAVTLCGGGTTVTVPPNATSSNRSICTPATTGPTTVTMTVGQGSTAISGSFQLVPPAQASSIVLAQSDIVGGAAPFTGTVTLGSTTSNPTSITIASSDPSVRFRPGTSGTFNQSIQLSIQGGQPSAGFQVQTTTVSSDTPVSITATPGTAQASLLVRAPSLSAVAVNPTSVQGGGTVSGQITFTTGAPSSGFTVQLSSSSPLVTVPPVVSVLPTASSASFAINTQQVTVDTPVTITATLNGVTRTATLTVLGPRTVTSFP
jgi:hypothetical protein